MRILQHNPPALNDKHGDWLVSKNNTRVFVEVKTPWEEGRSGIYSRGHYDKLFHTIKDAYKQRPKEYMPFLVFLTDELNISPSIDNEELLGALYGKRGLCFKKMPRGRLEYAGYNIVDRRSIFQRNIRRQLSGVITLTFQVWVYPGPGKDEGNYHFKGYHNPYCHKECILDTDLLRPFTQFVPNYAKGKMEWI